MAILNSINPDDKDKDKDQTGQPQNLVSGEASNIDSSSTSPIAPATKGSSSGAFTNISNYLKANQNTNLAGKVAGNIQGQNNQVKQDINQAKDNFKNQAQSNRIPLNNPFLQQAVQDPTSIANDAQKLQDFTKMRDAQYQGPQGLQNTDKLQAGVQNVQQMSQEAGTEAGRFNLLRQMFNKPTYTSGQQKLDNLLLQTNPDQINALRGSGVQARQLGRDLNQSANQASAQAQDFAKEALQTRDATRNALDTTETSNENDILSRLATIQAQRQAALQGVTDLAKKGQMTADDLAKYGLTEGTTLYNLDPSQYITKGADANKYNIANADDYAKFSALAKLSGKDNTFLPDQFKDQANTLDDAYGFNKDQFLADLNQRQGAYNADKNTDTISYADHKWGETGTNTVQGVENQLNAYMQRVGVNNLDDLQKSVENWIQQKGVKSVYDQGTLDQINALRNYYATHGTNNKLAAAQLVQPNKNAAI